MGYHHKPVLRCAALSCLLRPVSQDYRTWAGSALALAVLRELQWQPESEAKRHVVEMVKNVARQLGNTPAVCRQCYIHPAVLEGFVLGTLAQLPRPRMRKGLRAEEVGLAMLLEKLVSEPTN